MLKWQRPNQETTAEVVWESMIPPVNPDPGFKDALEVASWLPLESGTAWLDFSQIDFNTAYSLTVLALLDDGSTRPVSRSDITFGKPEPGWPAAVIVNGAAVRLDGLLDVGFAVYPFERVVKLVQIKGRESVVRVALLTEAGFAPSVQA